MTETQNPKLLQEVAESYEQSSRRLLKALAIGKSGAGKTYSLRTAPRPILIDSFDPEGTICIADCANGSDFFIDNRWEKEQASNPQVYRDWEHKFDERVKAGLFNNLGTYVIDSLTYFSEALMNAILATQGKTSRGFVSDRRGQKDASGLAGMQDYLLQMNTLRDVIKFINSLPCHVIWTAHPDYEKDERTGALEMAPMVTGKLKQRLPSLFGEVYFFEPQQTSKGINFRMLTRSDGYRMAKTRIGNGQFPGSEPFDLWETPDYTALLKKANAG